NGELLFANSPALKLHLEFPVSSRQLKAAIESVSGPANHSTIFDRLLLYLGESAGKCAVWFAKRGMLHNLRHFNLTIRSWHAGDLIPNAEMNDHPGRDTVGRCHEYRRACWNQREARRSLG